MKVTFSSTARSLGLNSFESYLESPAWLSIGSFFVYLSFLGMKGILGRYILVALGFLSKDLMCIQCPIDEPNIPLLMMKVYIYII